MILSLLPLLSAFIILFVVCCSYARLINLLYNYRIYLSFHGTNRGKGYFHSHNVSRKNKNGALLCYYEEMICLIQNDSEGLTKYLITAPRWRVAPEWASWRYIAEKMNKKCCKIGISAIYSRYSLYVNMFYSIVQIKEKKRKKIIWYIK